MTSHYHYNPEAALLCADDPGGVPATVRDVVRNSASDAIVWEVERPACIWDDLEPPPGQYELTTLQLGCGHQDDTVIPADLPPSEVQQLAALIICRACADWGRGGLDAYYVTPHAERMHA